MSVIKRVGVALAITAAVGAVTAGSAFANGTGSAVVTITSTSPNPTCHVTYNYTGNALSAPYAITGTNIVVNQTDCPGSSVSSLSATFTAGGSTATLSFNASVLVAGLFPCRASLSGQAGSYTNTSPGWSARWPAGTADITIPTTGAFCPTSSVTGHVTAMGDN